jgi:hypothetical protein
VQRPGSADRLEEWAREDPENERVFWQSIVPRLLLLDVNAAARGNVTLHVEGAAAAARDVSTP